MKGNKPRVALDADVLRDLAEIHRMMKISCSFDFSKYTDEVIRISHKDLILLLNLIKKGELEVVVGNTVYHQVKHRKEVCDFMKEFCYFPNLNVVSMDELLQKTDELAMKYCTERAVVDDKELYPPMNLSYSPYNRKLVPSDDAYIMAEAAVMGCILLTGNGKHFIFRKEIKNDQCSRSVAVVEINKKYGYVQQHESRLITSKPVLFRKFCEWIREFGIDNVYNMPDVDSSQLQKASEIMP